MIFSIFHLFGRHRLIQNSLLKPRRLASLLASVGNFSFLWFWLAFLAAGVNSWLLLVIDWINLHLLVLEKLKEAIWSCLISFVMLVCIGPQLSPSRHRLMHLLSLIRRVKLRDSQKNGLVLYQRPKRSRWLPTFWGSRYCHRVNQNLISYHAYVLIREIGCYHKAPVHLTNLSDRLSFTLAVPATAWHCLYQHSVLIFDSS